MNAVPFATHAIDAVLDPVEDVPQVRNEQYGGQCREDPEHTSGQDRVPVVGVLPAGCARTLVVS